MEAAHGPDTHRDRTGVATECSERPDGLLALTGVLGDMRSESVESVTHVHRGATPNGGSRERAGIQPGERGIRLRPAFREPREDLERIAGRVLWIRSRPAVGGYEDRLGGRAVDRVLGARAVRALHLDRVGERLPDGPLAGRRRPVDQRLVKTGEQAAQLAEGALGQGEDPSGLGRRRRGVDDRALLFLEGVVEDVTELELLAPERPAGLGQVRIGEDREPREGLVERQDLLRASIPESFSMTLMIARLPSRPPPSRCSAL